MIRYLSWFFVLLWALPVAAQPLPSAQADLFLEFAEDVSGNDPDLMISARVLVETPPTTLEEIGFYGLENAPAGERALHGIISQLEHAGHLISAEDKYIYELPEVFESHGVATLPEDRLDVDLMAYFESVDEDGGITDAQWESFKTWFPQHVRALEQSVERKGFTLLSLRLPLGDTLYFWAASPELAAKWQGRAVYAGLNTQKYRRDLFVTISVTTPAWEDYWAFLTYALRIPEAHWDTPNGL